MPPKFFYQITVIEHNGSTHTGIRELITGDMEAAYEVFKSQAEKHYKGRMQDFDCVMLSKNSRLLKGYLKEEKAKKERRAAAPLPDLNGPALNKARKAPKTPGENKPKLGDRKAE